MKRWPLFALVALALVAMVAWLALAPGSAKGPRVYAVDIVTSAPHDREAFTEGLFYRDGVLYEGTGKVDESRIRKIHAQSGRELAAVDLPAPYFGEGIAALGDSLYQLSWQHGTGFVYRLSDLSEQRRFTYTGEGWGLTENGRELIMSDGTPVLRFLDPKTLQPVRTLTVTAGGCPVQQLNELEWVDGLIYANIWQTNLIARIDPQSGDVKSFLDVSTLGPSARGVDDVANGIAWDAGAKQLYVTGKRWPLVYQVREGSQVYDSPEAKALMTCAK